LTSEEKSYILYWLVGKSENNFLILEKGGVQNEKDLSTEETPKTKGTRLQKKNGNEKRTQDSFRETGKGQENPVLLRFAYIMCELNKLDFSKNHTAVKESREFQFLFKKGNSHVTYGFVCYYSANRLGQNRLGVVASKKVGNAVKRNRAKRVIREAFRVAAAKLNSKTDKRYDFVFVARGKTPYLKSGKVLALMEGFFDKITADFRG